MNLIRRGAAVVLGLALLAASGVAHGQAATGRVIGRVTDMDTGLPVGGVTVIVQGPQGEDATITDDKGQYLFTALPIGTYVIRFYVANTSAQVEQQGVVVSAEKTLRVNAKVPGTSQAAAQQTYVITGKAPSVDIGSTRIGATFDENYVRNIPNGLTYGDIIQKAPGVFFDPSGNVSIGGATGLENIYMVNGLNVTGVEFGNVESGAASISGGTNIPLEFLKQIDVNSGGYSAEFGGAMGGVINTVLKTGSNEVHGSVFGYWAPYWIAGSPNVIQPIGTSIGSMHKPDYDTNVGAEVGGPIIKDKLFFWLGFSPRFTNDHVFRLTYAEQEDPNNAGQPLLDKNGNPVQHELTDWRARLNETHKTYSYAGTLEWVPRPEHHLTLGIIGTPSYNTELRNSYGNDISGDPRWAMEQLNKTNTDVMLRWRSSLFDRHWLIEANAGLHHESYDQRSPYADLNNINQLEYWGTDLYSLEGAPGCKPTADGFVPCPLNPNYRTGGFGLIKTFTANRTMAEVKSTNIFEALGHHEIKYGWRMEYATLDQDRWYSGPLGSRALIQLAPNGGAPDGIPGAYLNHYTFFTLAPGQYPTDFGTTGMTRYPNTDLLYPPDYRDDLRANVSSLSNAFFLQESYSPDKLRNLTFNVGARLELQKLFDTYNVAFLDAKNFGPRLGAVYDPFNDGRSKISVSFGRYYEAIPLELAARYFGGEGIYQRFGVPLSACAQPNPYAWTGAGEWKNCPIPAMGNQMDPSAQGGSSTTNNGSDYPVQANLQGQYHNEIVATVEREVMEDMTVRIDYTHRWLGNIIEDGTADPSGSFINVLANPGNVPQAAIEEAQNEVANDQNQVNQLQAQVNSMGNNVDPNVQSQLANAQSRLGNAQTKLTNLQGLAAAPKPERTYDAIMLSVNKRFSKAWQARASYTYSRLVGNYEGLYQYEQNYFAPNGSNYADTPDLNINQHGPLPNDRPHNARLEGSYTMDVGRGQITYGLSFVARSGMPRNYISALIPNQQLVMLLPRGSAGRTPPVTQFDGQISYRRPISPNVNVEAYVSIFNLFNEQASLQVDDNYTYDMAAPIVNGTPADLKYAKNVGGQPLNVNQNYGRTLVYQAPLSGRLGMRLTF